jgi:hypothetical protein
MLMAVALGALIALLAPLWAAQLAISRIRTARRAPSPMEIPRVDIAETDLQTLMKRRTPVIIRGLIDSLDLDLVPDLAGLRSLAADDPPPFRVKTHCDHSPYFLYRGNYGAQLHDITEMHLDEFVPFMFEAEQAAGTCTYRLFGVSDLSGRVGDIVDDIARRLGERTDATPDRQASGLWIGSRGVVTPLHHDAWTGLLFQFHGSKRIRMFSPGDRANLYFSSPREPRAVWSRLPGRSADADLAEFPRFAHATPHEGQLEAGEVLFIPPYWSHEIEALEANISMPFRFTTGVREYLDPGFLVPAMEIFDSKFVHPRTLQK